MNAADRRRLTPVIGIAAVVLAALLIALWMGLGSGVAWQAAATTPPPPQVESTTPPPIVEPLEQYSVVWERPLFSPSRTPEPAATGESGSSGDLQLTGVIILPGLKMAILHDKRTGKDYRAIAGQPSRGSPVLVELHPRSAVVESGGSRLQLRLVPGPSAYAGNASESAGSDGDDGMEPEDSAGSDASVMVTRHGANDSAGRQAVGAGAASAEARARALRARIEARRRKAQQGGGG
ncbi:MAG TPA: hypothetical protein VFW75_05360 [Acetobacteraceae bacterium]|nr:hypothetical protein [Acetobacteraceae bacterium]